jgi:hypothetical protein
MPNETENSTVSEITSDTTHALKFGPAFCAVFQMPHFYRSFATTHPVIPYSARQFTVPALTVSTVNK